MADAKKCDVCGKLYEFNTVGRPILDNFFMTKIFVDFQNDIDAMGKRFGLDLCDGCARSIFTRAFPLKELNYEED